MEKFPTDRVQPEAINEVLQEIMVHVFVKNCKKCSFSALKTKVLGLHIESDHQYFFKIIFTNKSSSVHSVMINSILKKCLKKHKREVHYKRTFVCFICNDKFSTHEELQQHIQKR